MLKCKYSSLDLFAGISKSHQAMYSVEAICVFASEKDKNVRILYEANYIWILRNIDCRNYEKTMDT